MFGEWRPDVIQMVFGEWRPDVIQMMFSEWRPDVIQMMFGEWRPDVIQMMFGEWRPDVIQLMFGEWRPDVIQLMFGRPDVIQMMFGVQYSILLHYFNKWNGSYEYLLPTLGNDFFFWQVSPTYSSYECETLSGKHTRKRERERGRERERFLAWCPIGNPSIVKLHCSTQCPSLIQYCPHPDTQATSITEKQFAIKRITKKLKAMVCSLPLKARLLPLKQSLMKTWLCSLRLSSDLCILIPSWLIGFWYGEVAKSCIFIIYSLHVQGWTTLQHNGITNSEW